jgi:hypothetical protein
MFNPGNSEEDLAYHAKIDAERRAAEAARKTTAHHSYMPSTASPRPDIFQQAGSWVCRNCWHSAKTPEGIKHTDKCPLNPINDDVLKGGRKTKRRKTKRNRKSRKHR